MHGTRGIGNIRNAAIFAAAASALSGCVGEDGFTKSHEENASQHQLSGSVGDGPVVGALMSLRRSDGQLLAEFESDTNADYNVTVNTKSKNYPLIIEALGGIDLVTNSAPDFDLVGAVLEQGDSTIANVNPFTTIAIEVARELPGGLTPQNIATAES